VRLVTFNVWSGRASVDGRVDGERFAAVIRGLDADVLGLQEVDVGQERSGHLDLTAVAAEAMGAREHRFVAALTGTPGGAGTAATGPAPAGVPAYGIALLSRHPVEAWRVVRLPALPGRVPYVWPGTRRPRLVSDEPRVLVAALVVTPRGPMTVATTHLSFLPGWNLVQLRRAVAGLRDLPRPLVLLGDLNAGPSAVCRVSGLRSAGSDLTFPADSPTRQIDHVLVDGTAEPRTVSAPRQDVSDHRPLVVDL
jgi:endonuclease/exonuclease/phosphatase family metal-dependent hydrolase